MWDRVIYWSAESARYDTWITSARNPTKFIIILRFVVLETTVLEIILIAFMKIYEGHSKFSWISRNACRFRFLLVASILEIKFIYAPLQNINNQIAQVYAFMKNLRNISLICKKDIKKKPRGKYLVVISRGSLNFHDKYFFHLYLYK